MALLRVIVVVVVAGIVVVVGFEVVVVVSTQPSLSKFSVEDANTVVEM